LHDGGSRPNAARQNHVSDAEVHKIATSQLAIDREVEQRKVAYPVLVSELGADSPDIFRLQRRFGADHESRVPRVPNLFG